MDPTVIYAIGVLAALTALALKSILPIILRLYRSWAANWLLGHVIYPYCSRRLRHLLPLRRWRVVLIAIYMSGTLLCNVYGSPSVEMISQRAGWISFINLIPLFITGRVTLAMKSLGLTWEQSLTAHVASAFVVLGELAAHIFIELQNWTALRENSFKAFAITAAVGLGTASTAILFRRVLFEAFVKLHSLSSIVAALALWRHTHRSRPEAPYVAAAVIACSGIFVVQLSTMFVQNWLLQSHSGVVRARHRGSACVLDIEFRKNFKLRPGQFVNIWMPSLGFWSLFQLHPQMISWTDGRVASVLIQERRGFSRDVMSSPVHGDSLIWVDGPFGDPPDFGDFEHVVLIAEGIGLCAQLLIMKDILQRYNARATRVKRVCLFWKIESAEMQDWVKPWIDELLDLDVDYIWRTEMFTNDDFDSSGSWGNHGRVRKWDDSGDLIQQAKEQLDSHFESTIVSVSAGRILRREARQMVIDNIGDGKSTRYYAHDFQTPSKRLSWSKLFSRTTQA